MKHWISIQFGNWDRLFRISGEVTIIVVTLGILSLLSVPFSGCGTKDHPEESAVSKLSVEESGPSIVKFSTPELEPNYWQTLLQLQDSIALSPSDSLLRKLLCDRSYFPQNRAIVVVGIGRLRNPKTDKPIPTGFARQAAFSSAARWAAYVKTWLERNYQPEFGAISTALNLPSQVVKEHVKGDSLLLEVAFEYLKE